LSPHGRSTGLCMPRGRAPLRNCLTGLVCDVSPASSRLARRPIVLNAGSCAARKWFHLRQWHHLPSRPSPSSRVKSHSSASLPRRLGARGTRTSSLATLSQSSITRIVFSPSPQSPRSTGRPRWRLRPLPSPAQYILEGPRLSQMEPFTHMRKRFYLRLAYDLVRPTTEGGLRPGHPGPCGSQSCSGREAVGSTGLVAWSAAGSCPGENETIPGQAQKVLFAPST
jgi:hypothetical protein